MNVVCGETSFKIATILWTCISASQFFNFVCLCFWFTEFFFKTWCLCTEITFMFELFQPSDKSDVFLRSLYDSGQLCSIHPWLLGSVTLSLFYDGDTSVRMMLDRSNVGFSYEVLIQVVIVGTRKGFLWLTQVTFVSGDIWCFKWPASCKLVTKLWLLAFSLRLTFNRVLWSFASFVLFYPTFDDFDVLSKFIVVLERLEWRVVFVFSLIKFWSEFRICLKVFWAWRT